MSLHRHCFLHPSMGHSRNACRTPAASAPCLPGCLPVQRYSPPPADLHVPPWLPPPPRYVCLYDVAERVMLRRFQISHNKSLDGVLDQLNSK